ncbi:hypothetical protein ES707_05548 [subsurface metagenome]
MDIVSCLLALIPGEVGFDGLGFQGQDRTMFGKGEKSIAITGKAGLANGPSLCS